MILWGFIVYTSPMLDELRIAVVIPAYNEAHRLRDLIPAIPCDIVDEIVVINDQSTDGTGEVARSLGAYVIDREERGGPGPGIRAALDLLRSGERGQIDAVVIMAANGKHDPAQIKDMVRPIAEEGMDLVRGSRFINGGMHTVPWHRLKLIKLFTFLAKVGLRQDITDATGGYQAYRLSILNDPSIDLHQRWLGRYRSRDIPDGQDAARRLPVERDSHQHHVPGHWHIHPRTGSYRLVGLLPADRAAAPRFQALRALDTSTSKSVGPR